MRLSYFFHIKSLKNTHLQLSTEFRLPRWARNFILKWFCGQSHGFVFRLLVASSEVWCMLVVVPFVLGYLGALKRSYSGCHAVLQSCRKCSKSLMMFFAAPMAVGVPPPPVLGVFRSQFCGWHVGRVPSCITAPKKKSDYSFNWDVCQKFPLCDRSGPLGCIHACAGTVLLIISHIISHKAAFFCPH